MVLESARGYRKRHGPLTKAEAADPAADDEGTRVPLAVRRSWARLLRQVYEIDPLLCPRCGGTMTVIAVIERPAIVRQILDRLGLPSGASSLRPAPDQINGLAGDQPHE